jgi:hypothetical protein
MRTHAKQMEHKAINGAIKLSSRGAPFDMTVALFTSDYNWYQNKLLKMMNKQ